MASRRMRSPWISIVSPSITDAMPKMGEKVEASVATMNRQPNAADVMVGKDVSAGVMFDLGEVLDRLGKSSAVIDLLDELNLFVNAASWLGAAFLSLNLSEISTTTNAGPVMRS